MLSILIVEDDITFSLMLTTWLGKKGFVVRSSSSVSDAKRRLGEEVFDFEMAVKHSSFLSPYHDDQLCGDTYGGSGDEAGSGGLYCQAVEPG